MSENNSGIPAKAVSNRPNIAWVVSPKEFIFRYLRYIPWVIASVVIMMSIAFLKVRYTNQIYQVQSSMLIKSDAMGGSNKDQRFNELMLVQDNVNLDNEIQILKSRPVLFRVVNDLHLQYYYNNRGKVRTSTLYPETPFKLKLLNLADSVRGFGCKITLLDDNSFLVNESKTPETFGNVIEVNGNRIYLEKTSAFSLHSFGSVQFEIGWQPTASVVESIIGNLRIAQINDRSTILALTFEHENVDLGKDILNKIMSVYDSLVVEDKNRIAYNTLKFIDARLYELSDTLRGMQGGLKNFMVENNAYDIESQAKGFIDKIEEVSAKKDEQEVKLNVIDWLIKYIGDKSKINELVPTNLGIEEPALILLVEQYNKLQLERENNLKTAMPDNPMIKAMDVALEKVRSNIYQTLTNVRQAYLIAGDRMTRNQVTIKQNIQGLPGKSIQMMNIQRQQKIFEELYSLLLSKKVETSIASASTISNSQIIEPAISGNYPISPDVKKIYTFYFIIGLMIPIGIIAMKELLQDKVIGRPDIEKQTSTPIMGEVGHSSEAKSLVVTTNSRRFISEQFRIIRTNLQYMIGKKENPVIMVTSSFSGEGKSFISTNIAAVMGLTGKKTVIMEFDIRKPKILAGLDLKRKLGISNYIIGKATIDDVIVKVEGAENLYVIPCGPIPPNPSELLLDERLDQLMKEVRERFEVVIMDTAPVGLVSDAITLGKFADITLFIVRQKYTFKKQLAFIEELYVTKKVNGLCLVLNDVKNEGGYYGGYYGSYGYAGSYAYGIGSGYFENEESRSRGRIFGFFRKKKS